MAGQTSIRSLAEQNLRGLAVALDVESPNGEEYWRLLVDQLPRGSFKSWEVERFAAATLKDQSPSLLLMEVVQQRQLVSTVEELVIVLKRIECDRALNALALKSEVIITQQPMDYMVQQGDTIRLYCGAECEPHGPLYQWFICQVGEGGTERTLPFRGATEKQLVLLQADITHHGRYCCRCTNPYMEEREEGRVKFSKWAKVTVAGVPVILKEPDPFQSCHIGQDLILSVRADCHPDPPVYQWFRISQGKDTPLEGHREAVLKFRICTFEDAGEYFCVVGNPLLSEQQGGWRASTMTVVQVLPPDVDRESLHHDYTMLIGNGEESEDGGSMIDGQELPQPQSRASSEAGRNSVVRHDQQGAFEGIARTPTPRPGVLPLGFPVDQQSIAGQSMHNYPSAIQKVDQPQSTNTGGSLPTPATEEGNILFTVQPQDMTVLVKQTFTVHCKAETGSGNLLYQLFEHKINGDCSAITSPPSMEDSVADIVMKGGLSGPKHEVQLFVRAFKAADSSVHQDSVHFKVQLEKAMFVAQPLERVNAIAGQEVMLMCRMASSEEDPPKVSYQWFRGESRGSNDFKFLTKENNNILRLSNLAPNDTGYYGCRACVVGQQSDMYYSTETHLTVGGFEDGEIVITEGPSPRTVDVKCGGEYKLFACAMSSVGEPLQFVWQKDGRPLPAKGPTLEIKSATTADRGTYTCKVSAVGSEQWKETAAVEVAVPCPADPAKMPVHQKADPAKVPDHQKAETYITGKLRGKVALLIANQDYQHHQKLQLAEEDVKKLAKELRTLGFKVLSLANLTSREMQVAEEVFCNQLLSKDATGVLAFVYFAGHGFFNPQESSEYLMPVDAKDLNHTNNINRDSFCLALRSTPKCAKLVRITDCCRTVSPSEDDVQPRFVRPNSSLQRQNDYYNFIDVTGCGYSRTAIDSFLANILQQLMAQQDLTLRDLISGIQDKAVQYDQNPIHQRPQVIAQNMIGYDKMKLSDVIDMSAYAHVADPASDQKCVERWTKLDPSGLPKDLVLPLNISGLREKAVVKLTLEEIFSNVLGVTVCAERLGTGTYALTVKIDVASLRSQGGNGIEVRDLEAHITGNKHSIEVRNIQRLKSLLELTIHVCMNNEPGRQEEKLTYTVPAPLLYAALKPS